MRYEIIKEGFVTKSIAGTSTSLRAGSRCVRRPNGEMLCTFVAAPGLGVNGFKPMMARSTDDGRTWSEAQFIFPELAKTLSLFASISAAPQGDVYLYGMRTEIDQAGELFWSEATQGLKENDLFWTKSADGGTTWEPLHIIPMPVPGSAEAPGAMCVTRNGTMVCCYAPYATFDPAVKVDTKQVIVLTSRDAGKTWSHRVMLRFPEPGSQGAEAWVVELSDGRLLGTTWHILHDQNMPNKYALSSDAGRTWTPTLSTGIIGQSTALAPLPDGRAIFMYNQRKVGEIGVWMAIVKPTEKEFGVEANQLIWSPEIAFKDGGSAEHKDWMKYAFGEPSATLVDPHTALVTFWVSQPSGFGIRYALVRFRD